MISQLFLIQIFPSLGMLFVIICYYGYAIILCYYMLFVSSVYRIVCNNCSINQPHKDSVYLRGNLRISRNVFY